MPVSTENSRIKGFKHRGKDLDDGRRRRNEVSVGLRKERKDDQLTKKRQITEESLVSPLKENNQQNTPLMKIEDIKEILTSLSSDQEKFNAVQNTRRLLSRERNPPIDKVIKAGLVPILINFLQYEENTKIQFEAAWAVTNIASGTSDQTRTIVEAGGVDCFRKLLSSGELQVCEQAVWALGNIAGDGPEYRDLVIASGCVRPLLNLITSGIQIPFLRNVTWTLSNLCRNKNPPPDLSKILDILPVLASLICNEDEEVIADACWALSYLTDGENEKITTILQTGIVPRLVNLLSHSNASIVTPSLRTIGNIVTGDDKQTQEVLDNGALAPLCNLFNHPKTQIVKETTWTISNIAAGPPEQIVRLINAEIMPLVIKALAEGDFKVKSEAVWVITNFSSGGTLEHVKYLLKCNVIEPLCKMLDMQDSKTIVVTLESVRNILSKCKQMTGANAWIVDGKEIDVVNEITLLVEQYNGIDYLEKLQTSENDMIQSLAYKIIDEYFEDGEEVEDDMIAPAASSSGYQFAAATNETNFAL